MKATTIDYHGYTVNEALFDLESQLSQLDPNDYHTLTLITGRGKIDPNDYHTLTLITGRGKIKEAIIEYLDDQDIEWIVKLGNEGCILVEVPQDI
jgi:hypothetical protein